MMTKERIEEVIRTTATVSSEADFMLTHMPFKALVDYVKPADETTKAHYLIDNKLYTYADVFEEGDLLDDMLESPNKHKFIMIQGKNGSGKSHLVRWLYYNYRKNTNPEKELSIFIPRAHNTLKETIKDILSAGVLSGEREKMYLDKVQGGTSGMSEIEFKETIYAVLSIIVKNNENAVLSEKDRIQLYKYLSDSEVKDSIFLRKDGPIDKLCKKMDGKLDEGDGNPFQIEEIYFSVRDIIPKLQSANHKAEREVLMFAQELANQPAKRKAICQYLNSQVELVMQRTSSFKGSDLKEVFAEIRKELKSNNQAMSLFIEDINSFTGIDSAIIEVLIQDHEEFPELCRLTSVIGSTDYFFDKFHDSLKERLTRNVVILETALLKNEDWIVEFAARYINAINLTKEDSVSWLASKEEHIPIWKSEYPFSEVIVNGVTMSVFPFTRTALINLYNLLPATSRSPRCFLRDIIKHVELKWIDYGIKIINSERNFFNESISTLGMFATSADSAANDVNIPDESEKRGILLKVWGNKTFKKDDRGNLGGIDKEIFEFFNVKLLGEISSKAPAKGPQPAPPTRAVVDTNDVLNSKLSNIEQWGGGNITEFKLHREARELVGRFILRTINWEKEEVQFDIANSVLKEISAIFIEGQPVSGNGIIQIERCNESVRLLKALFSQSHLAKGRGWDYENGAEEQIFANTWLFKNKKDIVARVKKAALGNVDIEYICVKASLCQKILDGDFLNTTPEKTLESLFRPVTDHEVYEKGDKWVALAKAYKGHEDAISELLSISYRAVIGESDVKNSKYVYIDAAKALEVINQINDEGLLFSPKKVSDIRLDGRPGSVLSALKVFYDQIDDVYDEELMLGNRYKNKIVSLLGDKPSEIVVKNTLTKVYEYLRFIKDEIKRPFDPNEFRILDTDNARELYALVLSLMTILKEESKANKLIMLSTHNTKKMARYIVAFDGFVRFVSERNESFKLSIDLETDRLISQKHKAIITAVESRVKEDA